MPVDEIRERAVGAELEEHEERLLVLEVGVAVEADLGSGPWQLGRRLANDCQLCSNVWLVFGCISTEMYK